ncbi:hypothetical protein [Pseudorhodoferax sp.]|uniref:hypothetical protein n=1 Tax=Pseudorhodoferax sp. TaxID=1993553 RepID=UPI0039E5B7FF
MAHDDAHHAPAAGSLTPEAAEATLDALLAGRRVAPCVWDGQPAFAKRLFRRRPWEGWLLGAFAPLLRRLLAPGLPFTPVRRTALHVFEVQRLRELHAAGAAVPRVLAVARSAFVMEPAGRPLPACGRDGAAPRADLLLAAAEDLAQFHRAGHWHGGAQIRNVAWNGTGFVRFDFDRAFDRHFPLPMLQALDVLLFLSSLADIDAPGLLEAAATACCAGEDGPVLGVLARLRPTVQRLGHAGWMRALAAKEARRCERIAAALGPALAP